MSTIADELWNDAAQPNHDSVFGVSVTYSGIGSGPAVSFTAIPESIPYGGFDNEGMTTNVTGRNYSLAVADHPSEPLPGDRLTETINGVVCTFEVMPLPGSKRAARLISGGFRWLIHTVKVS